MSNSKPAAVLELVFDHPVYFEGMSDFLDLVNERYRHDSVTFNDDAEQESNFYGVKYVISVVRSGDATEVVNLSRCSWLHGVNFVFNGDRGVLKYAESFVEELRQHFVLEPERRNQQWFDRNRR